MTEDAPRIAATLERTKLFVGASLMLLQAPLMFQRNNSLAAVMFLLGLLSCLSVARVLSTQVSAVGITQLTWRGRLRMRWEEVTGVVRRQRDLVLRSSKGSIVVPTQSFYDTPAAVAYVESHLPKSLRQP